MNKLLDNLMTIDAMINSVEDFIPIKLSIESLETDDPNYLKLVENTNLLIKVMKAFARRQIYDT